MRFSSEEVSKHFDKLAFGYGRKNAKIYYNLMIYKLMKSFMNDISFKSVLDIGCGNGDFLRWLKPMNGIGIDISPKMINIANQVPNTNLNFYVSDVNSFNQKMEFDYIVMIDVIEHLSDLDKTINALSSLAKEHTKILISFSNPFWNIPFKIFEFLKIKDPEGPHNLTSIKKLKKILYLNNFKIVRKGYYLLLPLNIPLLSDFVNSVFYKIPLLKNLGMTQYVVCRLEKSH